tara:strand:+ start:2132 stop:4240 length:2109 start_codon:yes stop_codon:yes gene_type:complete
VARLSKAEKWAQIHAAEIAAFGKTESACHDERKQAVEDRRFYSIAGAQWAGPLGKQYENRVKLEINKVHLALIRIINEYRNNRISVEFVSKTGEADDDLADLCAGLYRADEQDSEADEAFDNAFEEALGGGFGAFRLRTEYEDEEDDDDDRQRIRIEPIYDADTTVYFDLDAKRQDKSDARRCWVLTPMSPDAYEDEWGDSPSSWPKGTNTQGGFQWATPDVVYVAEVYCVEETTETVQTWLHVDGSEEKFRDQEFEDDETLSGELTAKGAVWLRDKQVKRRKVRKYIMSGSKVLSDEGYIAGNMIPIIPTYGKRWFVDNIERFMGHVRLAKDAQRLLNMQMSGLAEISAKSPIEKPIFTSEQVAGHEMRWANDPVENYAYMLINPVEDAAGNEQAMGPVGFVKPPMVPPAMAALLQLADQSVRDILGNQEQGDELQSNQSGIAMEAVQKRLDMQTEIYLSNHAKGVKRGGEVWLAMARDIFVEKGRKMKSLGVAGESEVVELYVQPTTDPKTGEIQYKNDMTRAKFDVAIDVGPSSTSKRNATVRSLTGMMQMTQDPEMQMVLGSMALMNMEGEGIGDVRRYARKKLVAMGVIEPTADEEEEMKSAQENQQPDANAALLLASAEEATAKAEKVRAEIVKTLAEVEETGADTELTRAKIIKTLEEAYDLGAIRNTGAVEERANAPGQRPAAQPIQPGEITGF